MYWYWLVIVFIVLSGLLSVGIYMLYSAITGKGIPEPDSNSLWQFRVQYKLRGLVGLGFTISGGVFLIFLIQYLIEG